MNAQVSQSVELASELLTAKQEAFARYYCEYQNASTAYRMAYNVAWNIQPTTVWEEASRALAHPLVAARIEELLAAAAATTIIKARDVLQAQLDVAGADANDIIRYRALCCRHCYGEGYAYQWQELEWTFAAADAEDNSTPDMRVKAPSCRGGFGFDPQREPNPTCPQCRGAGVHAVYVTDTDKLPPKTRRLYRGIKIGSNGQLEVLMEDRADARKEVAKLLGAYQTEGKVGELGLPPPVDAPLDASTDPTQGYMDMVQRPALR
jgi:phage terminase small subunit